MEQDTTPLPNRTPVLVIQELPCGCRYALMLCQSDQCDGLPLILDKMGMAGQFSTEPS